MSDEGWASVNDDINKVKIVLTNPNNIKMHVAADLDKLCEINPDASSMLKQILPNGVKSSDKL